MKLIIDSIEELVILVQLIRGQDPDDNLLKELTRKLESSNNNLEQALEQTNG